MDETNNEAEDMQTLLTINLVSKVLISKLHLKENLQIIVNAIIKSEAQNWKLYKFIKIIREKSNSFLYFKVSRIRQDGNKVSNTLLKWVRSFNARTNEIWWDDFQ